MVSDIMIIEFLFVVNHLKYRVIEELYAENVKTCRGDPNKHISSRTVDTET